MKRATYFLRTHLSRLITLTTAGVILVTPAITLAKGYENYTAKQLQTMGIYFVNSDFSCGDTSVSAAAHDTAVAGSDPYKTGTWNSGLQPPFILEQFMIELLKDIAQKRGVSPTETVTEEHVIALVAFAIGEGGDINNRDLFNPFNNGINVPDLLATDHNTSGLQSFRSFDAGVEANARGMVGPNQRRLSDILIQKGSTAQDFMKALTYFQKYPGNKLWAEASLPPHQDSYYAERLKLIAQVQRDYNFLAALVIGTPEFEFKTRRAVPSKLQYHPSTARVVTGDAYQTPGDGACGGCTDTITDASCDSAGDSDIVKEAMRLAWPSGSHGMYKKDATPAYQVTMPSSRGAGFTSNTAGDPAFSDCGVFVATVMRSSNADPQYVRRGTAAQLPYLRSSGKYIETRNVKSTGDLKPGDILITDCGGRCVGHTYIYTGPQATGSKTSVGASWFGHVPQATNFYQDVDGQHFTAFSLKAQRDGARGD